VIKKLNMLILIDIFYIAGICFAAPVGNPAGPVLLEGSYPVKFSLEAETVLERKLASGNVANPTFNGTFYTGKFSLYVGNKLDVYGIVGLGDGKVKKFPDENYIIESKMAALWGLGISYVLREFEFMDGLLRIGVDAKYRQFEPDMDVVKYYREPISTRNQKLTFKEWQASLGFAYQYKKLIPYLGLKYSDVDSQIHFNNGSTTYSDKTVTSKNNFGLFYGLDIIVKDNVSFNIEGRSLDEEAANLGLNARF